MNELDSLARELKKELGTPPEGWQRAQRERVREALQSPPRRLGVRALAPVLAAALVALGVLAWGTLRGQPPHASEAARSTEALAGPIRLEDGSSIVLSPGGHGRLATDAAAVRFELQSGRADFDVVPGQKRTWTITAGKNVVTVLGTRFSVSYQPSGEFDVNVERGVVSVRVPDRPASVELRGGDRLSGSSGRSEVLRRAPEVVAEAVLNGQQEPLQPPSSRSSTSTEPQAIQPVSPPSTDWRGRYRDGKYAEALALLRASRDAERLEELGPRALAEVADVARLGGDPKLATRALTLLLRQYPKAGEARDAQFLLGRVHALSGARAAAAQAFEAYLEPGGSTRYATEAMGRLMEIYEGRGDAARARAMARRYLETAPNGPYRRLALSLTQ